MHPHADSNDSPTHPKPYHIFSWNYYVVIPLYPSALYPLTISTRPTSLIVSFSLPLNPLSMTQNLVRRHRTSISPEQQHTETSGRESFKLAQKLRGDFSGILRELYNRFSPPKLIKEAPNFRKSIKVAKNLNSSCESLPAGRLFDIP